MGRYCSYLLPSGRWNIPNLSQQNLAPDHLGHAVAVFHVEKTGMAQSQKHRTSVFNVCSLAAHDLKVNHIIDLQGSRLKLCPQVFSLFFFHQYCNMESVSVQELMLAKSFIGFYEFQFHIKSFYPPFPHNTTNALTPFFNGPMST